MINKNSFQPAIIFSFSKRDVELLALQLSSINFCNDEEKLIDIIFKNAIESLTEDDRKLPQIQSILPLLKNGIGLHHGGLLPILKEIVEILFQEGLLKILCATETFAMGLNMPAKTVVFTDARKFDGQIFRHISSGEYIQMSGRAGRRGLDDKGIVILMLDNILEPLEIQNIMKGNSDPLNSTFHLGYNMILNLMRVEEASPEFMMSRSFLQFQTNLTAPSLINEINQLKEQINQINYKDDLVIKNNISELYQLIQQEVALSKIYQSYIYAPSIHISSFLNKGRLIEIYDYNEVIYWGWGIITKYIINKQNQIIISVLLPCNKIEKRLRNDNNVNHKITYQAQPINIEQATTKANGYYIINILSCHIKQISAIKLYLDNKNLKSQHECNQIGSMLKNIFVRFKDSSIPLLDPINDLKIYADDIDKQQQYQVYKDQLQHLKHRISTIKQTILKNEDIESLLLQYEHEIELLNQIKLKEIDLKNATNDLAMRNTLNNMKRVLRRLGLTNSQNIVDLKGRIACQISTSDELVTTEMMFNGVFNDLDTPVLVALISCLVFEERNDVQEDDLPKLLYEPYKKVINCS